MNEIRERSSVEVIIDLTKSNEQEVKVTISWTPTLLEQNFGLPVWTPGSYKVRDHIQNLYCLEVTQNSKELSVQRVETNQWKAKLENLDLIKITYIVQARYLTVRTSYVDSEFASLCLPSVIMYITEFRNDIHKLKLKLSDHWNAYIPLAEKNRCYYANNYDDLVDAHLLSGNLDAQSFYVNDLEHKLICLGQVPGGWPKSLLKDISSICEIESKLFKEDPPSGNRYMLIIHFLDKAYGGLEHDNCAVLHFDWRTLHKENGYRKLLQLIAHEYFHQWNVKRLRPKEYKEYNYNKAVISDSLWFAEGVTSY